jgi:drug/metabolite transporter (DMT)-like permease
VKERLVSKRWGRTDLLVLGSVVIWAVGFSVAKYGLREIAPLAFAAIRFLASAAITVVWVWITEGKPVIRTEDWLWVALVGVLQIGLYQVFFSVGLSRTTAANASLFDGSAPLWTAILAVASRQERVTPLQALGILLSFGGLAVVATSGDGGLALSWQNLRGDLSILLAASLTGVAAMVSKRPLRRYSSLRLMSLAMVWGSLFLLPFAWGEIVSQPWGQVSPGAWLALAYSIGPAAVVAYVIYFKSIGEIGATRTAAYNTLLPPLAVVIAMMTLGERLTPLQALGAMVVVSGVILARFAPAKAPWPAWSGLANHRGSRWPPGLPRGAGSMSSGLHHERGDT